MAPPKERCRIPAAWYLAGLLTFLELEKQLKALCLALGVNLADQVVILTDGGNGLEEFLTRVLVSLGVKEYHFILDFWHVVEHLEEFAKVFLASAADRTRQVDAWCHKLKHASGAAVLAELEALDLRSAALAVTEEHRKLTNFLRKNLHRTDYPSYLKNGWEIGSGAIESACKNVVGERLKGSGMRWHEPGTNELCHVRALHKSHPHAWRDYWLHRQHHPLPRPLRPPNKKSARPKTPTAAS